MSRWGQLYWPVDIAMPAGDEELDREFQRRKRSILTRYLSSTRKMRQELSALRKEWAKVFDQLSELYDDLAPTWEGDAMARWLGAINYRSVITLDEERKLGMEPFMTANHWDTIDGSGEFAKDAASWTSPQEMVNACLRLISLIEAGNEIALRVRNAYVERELPADDPRLSDVSWRKEQGEGFVVELRRTAENATKCKERGVEKVGFLIYM